MAALECRAARLIKWQAIGRCLQQCSQQYEQPCHKTGSSRLQCLRAPCWMVPGTNGMAHMTTITSPQHQVDPIR